MPLFRQKQKRGIPPVIFIFQGMVTEDTLAGIIVLIGHKMTKYPHRLSIKLFILSVTLILQVSCKVNPITYDSGPPYVRPVLNEVSGFGDQVTGVAVTSGERIFVSFPRRDREPRYSLAELLSDGSLRPFPDAAWNKWAKSGENNPDSHFISVQGIFASDKTLWVLDSPSPFFRGPFPGAAKLVGIDLGSNSVKKVIKFDNTIVPEGSYLCNVCIDQWETMAYVSDAGNGALIVTDLGSGFSRRVLADHPSTKGEPGVRLTAAGKELRTEAGKPFQLHVDGIALDVDSTFLYYHALTARTLYRINTRYLNDPIFTGKELADHVERLADTGVAAGLVMDSDYNLYITSPEESAIKRYRVYDGSLVTLVRDERLVWPGSICKAPLDFLYLTDSQFNRMPFFNGGKDRRTPPYILFRIHRELMPAI